MCSSLAKTNRFKRYKPKTLTKNIPFPSTTKKNTVNHIKTKLYLNHQRKSKPKHKNLLYSSNDEEHNTKKTSFSIKKHIKIQTLQGNQMTNKQKCHFPSKIT